MDISLFLAKLFGLYLTIVSVLLFARRDFLPSVIEDFYRSPALILFSAVFNLIIGLLVVLTHNVWEWNWRVIITIFGYLSIAKGIIHLFRPSWLEGLSRKMIAGNGYVATGAINLVIGVYLIYVGFFG